MTGDPFYTLTIHRDPPEMLRSTVPGEYVSVHMYRALDWTTQRRRVFRPALYQIVYCDGFDYDSLDVSEKMLVEYALAEGGRIVHLNKA